MTTSTTKAERHRQALQDRLPPGTVVHTHVSGHGILRWSLRLTMIASIAVLVWDVGLLLGYVLAPGALLVLVVVRELRPPRTVALTSSGLVIAACSFWTSAPTVILAAGVPGHAMAERRGKRTTLTLGPERVSLPTYGWYQLGLDAPAPPWFPPPCGSPSTATVG